MTDHGVCANPHLDCNSRNSSGSDLSHESEGESKREPVSEWLLEDLWSKRIFYNDHESTLKELRDLVVEKSKREDNRHKFICPSMEDIPDIFKQLVLYTQRALAFSFNESGQIGDGVFNVENYEEALRAMADFDSFEVKLNSEIEKIGLCHNRSMLILSWCFKIREFLRMYKEIAHCKLSKAVSKTQYTELLRAFTRVVHLDPRVGTEREMQINTINVTSTPDLHFVKNMPATRFQVIRTTLLACVEAKRQVSGPEFFCMEESVLAQHGGELLLEVQESVLFPRVLGMICWQSSVMLTYLDLNRKHLEEIIKGEESSLKKERSMIYYTKSFDYLVKEQRDELLETLFWLGYIQTMAK
uniref:Uncharacterized protein LOC111106270 isoform X2 n=1 Tax=Crassostrea virginica TaxID=6565 RepID=A0A8B8B0P5_CRAVI|nr:uncharacterized protein LOC111106270 isoform X2 [Crassostrea virginica]